MKQAKSIYPRVRIQKNVLLERGHMETFARSTGAQQPIFFDSAHAQKCGYKDIIAHPTYPVTFEALEDVCEKIEVDPHALMPIEQRLEYAKPMFPGEEIITSTRLVDGQEKTVGNNKIVLIKIETSAKSKRNKDIFKFTRTFIYTPSH